MPDHNSFKQTSPFCVYFMLDLFPQRFLFLQLFLGELLFCVDSSSLLGWCVPFQRAGSLRWGTDRCQCRLQLYVLGLHSPGDAEPQTVHPNPQVKLLQLQACEADIQYYLVELLTLGPHISFGMAYAASLE